MAATINQRCVRYFVVATAVALIAASASAATARAERVDLGCPSGADAPYGIQVWLKVVKWCALPAVRGQAQIKLQLKITNTGRRPLDISRPHIRLIVRSFNRKRWTPPRIGQRTTERPFKTKWRGKSVWAIPPNAERAYDPIPGEGGVATFATHWNETSLAPRRTTQPRNRRRGNVVFYVPRGRRERDALSDVIGVAYVRGRNILVVCPPHRWDGHRPAGDF